MGRHNKIVERSDSRDMSGEISKLTSNAVIIRMHKPLNNNLKPPALVLLTINAVVKTVQGMSSNDMNGIHNPPKNESNNRLLVTTL